MVLQVFLTQTMGKFSKPRSHPHLITLIRWLCNKQWEGLSFFWTSFLDHAGYKKEACSINENILLCFSAYVFEVR